MKYTLNEDGSRWRVLRQLIRELADPVDVARDALSDVPGVLAAFVFGSFARGDVRKDSDVDVFILGEGIPEDLLSRRTLDAGVLLGREVNVVQMTRGELRERLQAGSGFLTHVFTGAKRWLVGDERTLSSEPPTSVIA